MPPASLAHFKHRGGGMSGVTNGTIDHSQLPPNKRARESPAKPPAAAAPAAEKEITPPRDAAGKNQKVAAFRSSPPIEEKKIVKGKDLVVGECSAELCVKGNYDFLDPEILDCALCSNPLFIPIYQCKNGHTACTTCWSNLERAKKTCHSCAETIWNIRCLVMEKTLENLWVRCHHAVYGCSEFLMFLHRKEHEEQLCRYRPYKCPVDACRYEGPKPALVQHFDKVHQMQALQIDRATRKVDFTMHGSQGYKLLQSDQELYVLFRESMAASMGDVFYCASFGPYRRDYMLSVGLRSEAVKSVFAIKATVPEIKGLTQWKLKRDFLIVPMGVEVDPSRANGVFDIEIELYGPVFQVPARIANSY